MMGSLPSSFVLSPQVETKSGFSFGKLMLLGFLIPIINTIFIELSTAAYLRNSFCPRLILRLNLLHLGCKSNQSESIPKSIALEDVNYTSLS